MAENFLQRAFQYYASQGLPAHQAAALAANAVAESGGNPTIMGDGGNSFGTFQWSPTRRQDLNAYAASQPTPLDPNDTDTQLGFALHELRNKEAAAGSKLFGAQDYRQATDAMQHYLRPAGFTPDNPGAAHNYVGRFNTGAALAGAQPMTGPAMAAAGGATPPPVNAGLLQQPPPQDIDPEIAQWSQYGQRPEDLAAAAAKERALASASSDLSKQGLGLLARSSTPAPAFASAGALFHKPDPQATPMPNFTQALMQQRLLRRT